MELIVASICFFGLCMGGMGIGFLISGKKLAGSCGDDETHAKLDVSCGPCVKKDSDVCPSSEENGELVALSTLGSPNRKV